MTVQNLLGLRWKRRYTSIKIASTKRKRIIGKVLHTRIIKNCCVLLKREKISIYISTKCATISNKHD